MEYDIIRNNMTGHQVICWQQGGTDFDLVCAEDGQFALHVNNEALYIRPATDDPIWYHLNGDGSISDRRVADAILWLPPMLDNIIDDIDGNKPTLRVTIHD